MDHDGEVTFRPWNPDKLRVPFGQSTVEDEFSPNSIFCALCYFFDLCFGQMYKKVIFAAEDSKKSVNEIIEEHVESTDKCSWVVRPGAILLLSLGCYGLLAPVSSKLKGDLLFKLSS